MEPGLRDGDWLLVDTSAFAELPPRVGDLVVVADPRQDGRLLVKRIRTHGTDGQLTIGGDHRAHADEEIPVALSAVRGRPWFRFAPIRRIGRIG
jgi:phage repressor protein C with HTH and peptisase S24 domain